MPSDRANICLGETSRQSPRRYQCRSEAVQLCVQLSPGWFDSKAVAVVMGSCKRRALAALLLL